MPVIALREKILMFQSAPPAKGAMVPSRDRVLDKKFQSAPPAKGAISDS